MLAAALAAASEQKGAELKGAEELGGEEERGPGVGPREEGSPDRPRRVRAV